MLRTKKSGLVWILDPWDLPPYSIRRKLRNHTIVVGINDLSRSVMDKIEAVLGNMVEIIEKGQAKHLPIGKNYRDDLLALVNSNRLWFKIQGYPGF